ncbi:MAG: DUF4389 domain-containing protein [Candidatus Berkiella sp.]
MDFLPENVKNSVKSKDHWIRGLYLVLFFFILYMVVFLLFFVGIFQFVTNLFMNKSNKHLLTFGQSLGYYYHDMIQYVTYNSAKKPFPFSPWPSSHDK